MAIAAALAEYFLNPGINFRQHFCKVLQALYRVLRIFVKNVSKPLDTLCEPSYAFYGSKLTMLVDHRKEV